MARLPHLERSPRPERSALLTRIHQAWVEADDKAPERMQQLEVDPDQFQEIIDGTRAPSVVEVALLAIAFQVSVDWLFSGEGPRYIGYVYSRDDPAAPTAQDEEGKPLVPVGWYCWRCHGVNFSPCKSDSVPIYIPAEWVGDMTRELTEKEDGSMEW